jgi:hypothetical protein
MNVKLNKFNMEDFKIGQDVLCNDFGVFNIINKHDKFTGWVDTKEPLILVYDGNTNKENYLTYCEYKDMDYDYVKNITIISKGYFDRKIYLTEDKPRYDIKNNETQEIIEGCYLHNGSWTIV